MRETQSVVGEMEQRLEGVKRGLDGLRFQRDRYRQSDEMSKEMMMLMKFERDFFKGRVEEAEKGRSEALEMVERLKRGEVLDGGEGGDEGQQAESGEEVGEGPKPDVQEVLLESLEHSEGIEEDEADEGDEATLRGSDDEEDDGYDVRSESERAADAEYEALSEGDASDAEEWRL